MLLVVNKRKITIRTLLFIFISLNILIPLTFIGMQNNSYHNSSRLFHDTKDPKIASFSKEDYEPILTKEKQALGDINITDLLFNEVGINSTDDMTAEYKEDLSSGSLKMNYLGTNFNSTIKKAQIDNIDENIIDSQKITVLLKESLSIEYNELTEDYLYYAPKLTPFIHTQLYVENETEFGLQKVNTGNYSIKEINNINFLRFDYRNYFTTYDSLNFRMYLLWEYNVTINNWRLIQAANTEDLLLEDDEINIINLNFDYRFNIKGEKYNGTSNFIVPADNLFINLTINLPDKELLDDLRLYINSHRILENFLNSDNSIFIPKDLLQSNNTLIKIEFSTSYQISFLEPVDETWSIDRLYEDRDKRERIYFPQIISGPERIYIKYIKVIEETISFSQVETSSSLFGRTVYFEEVNVTKVEEDIINSLVFNQNATKRAGIKITFPYMIRGEINPIIIKYETEHNLNIIVTDKIRVPIEGLDIEIYYYGELYGTYISADKNQPIGPQITDENGEILVKNVPNGNYTIKIYQNEKLIKEAEVSSYLEVNYITTPIYQFPWIIMIYSSIGILCFIVGLVFYHKQKTS